MHNRQIMHVKLGLIYFQLWWKLDINIVQSEKLFTFGLELSAFFKELVINENESLRLNIYSYRDYG